MPDRSIRTYGVVVLMALTVVLAGCSSPLGGGQPGDGTPTEPTATDAGSPTATPGTPTGTANGTGGSTEAAMTGRLLFVIEGQDTHLVDASSRSNASFWVNESRKHTWQASGQAPTLAEALSQLGINASADSLTYQGTTYRETENGTTIAYRADGTPIEDPTTYTLEDGDQIFVTVYTGNVSTPGRYLHDSHPHPHGTLNVTVDGKTLTFQDQKYVNADRYFHFHGDENRSRWHGHSLNLTVAYAISTFPGIELTGDSFTYDGTTYRASESDTTITVMVNGETVDPTTYVLKDGDDVKIVVNETD